MSRMAELEGGIEGERREGERREGEGGKEGGREGGRRFRVMQCSATRPYHLISEGPQTLAVCQTNTTSQLG